MTTEQPTLEPEQPKATSVDQLNILVYKLSMENKHLREKLEFYLEDELERQELKDRVKEFEKGIAQVADKLIEVADGLRRI